MAKTYTREERREARKFTARDTAATRRELERLEAHEVRLAALGALVTAHGAATAPRGWDFV